MLENLVAGLFRKPPPVRNAEDLASFIDQHAAFMAQKCVVEFCRVRAGVYWQKLFTEAEFLEALRVSRWASFAPAVAMNAEMIEGVLRPAAGLRQRHLPEAIEAVVVNVFARYDLPAGAPDGFWDDGLRLVRERLAATQSGPPRPVRNLAEPMAKLIFDALPIHQTIVTNDYDYIRNNLRMNLLRSHEDFVETAELDALVDDLLGKG
ncbi:MAG: hypothetical protein Q8Q62_14555 [Mesorhizobium sp.]|nr:hypothetical protein [Mesorhizobium sp.]